jgi:hypothetical protein
LNSCISAQLRRIPFRVSLAEVGHAARHDVGRIFEAGNAKVDHRLVRESYFRTIVTCSLRHWGRPEQAVGYARDQLLRSGRGEVLAVSI